MSTPSAIPTLNGSNYRSLNYYGSTEYDTMYPSLPASRSESETSYPPLPSSIPTSYPPLPPSCTSTYPPLLTSVPTTYRPLPSSQSSERSTVYLALPSGQTTEYGMPYPTLPPSIGTTPQTISLYNDSATPKAQVDSWVPASLEASLYEKCETPLPPSPPMSPSAGSYTSRYFSIASATTIEDPTPSPSPTPSSWRTPGSLDTDDALYECSGASQCKSYRLFISACIGALHAFSGFHPRQVGLRFWINFHQLCSSRGYHRSSITSMRCGASA
jgi:hypothetical protein